MADRYWVSGSGNWDASDTTHWSATSGGAGGASVPTAADDVIFDTSSSTANAAYTVTITGTTGTCKNFTMAGPGGGNKVTWAGGFSLIISGNLNLSGGTAGITRTFNGTLAFGGTSGTQTITVNGVVLPNMSLQGAGGTRQLVDDVEVQANLSFTAGTFDANGRTVTLSGNGPTITATVAPTFYNLTKRTGSPAVAAKTDSLTLTGNITVSNLFTADGGTLPNRCIVQSSVVGTPRTITAATVSLTNVDFMDITGAGAAAPFTGTSLGNALGNSSITFDAAVTQYWKTTTTGTKTWSTAANWFLGTNGTGGAGRVPLPQDDVVFDASSIGAASTTISADMPRLGKTISFSGVTNNPVYSQSATSQVFGSMTMGSGMTTSIAGAGVIIQMMARTPVTFQSNGVVFNTGALDPYVPGGSLTLLDAYTNTLGSINARSPSAIFNDGGFSVTVGNGYSAQTGTTTVKSGSWTIAASGTAISINAGATFTDTGGTIKLTDASSADKTFAGGGKTFNNIWLSGVGTGAYIFTGSNTFNDFKVSELPKNLYFTAATTTTVASVTCPAYSAAATKFVRLNRVSARNITTPNAAGSTLTGDMSVVVAASYTAVSPSQTLMAQGFTGGQYNWFFYVTAGGNPVLEYSVDGSTVATKTSSATLASVGIAVNQLVYLAVYHDVDNGAAGNNVKFYWSLDGSAWTQLGTTQTTAGTVTRFNSTSKIEVGTQLNGAPWSGDLYRARLYSGDFQSGGSVVADCNPNTWNTGNTWVSATTGETWTRNNDALLSPEVRIASVTSATHTLTKSGGGVVDIGRRGNVLYSIASPASTFYAGAAGTNSGNNTNWTFNNAPASAALATTDTGETLGSASALAIVAGASITEGSETLASASALAVHASLSSQDGSDALVAAGQLAVSSALVATDSESLLAVGTVTGGAVSATTDGDDVLGGAAYRWIPSTVRRYTIPVRNRPA